MQTSSEYDRALLYTYSCDWNQLILLMIRSDDKVFSKHIEHFLYAFHYEQNLDLINEKLHSLFRYIDHAQSQLENPPAFI